ncbi:MAG: phosphatidylglycerol lysyltransferase domain-containing protein [Muribaculaceae bacterium]
MDDDCETKILTGLLLSMADEITSPKEIVFNDLTLETLPIIYPFLLSSGSMSCDYTAGGIYMWIDYFKYQYCILDCTLFLKGVAQDDVTKTAFSLPIGMMPIRESVYLLKKYCDRNGLRLEFSAISEERIEEFKDEKPKMITELVHWADYIYLADDLATLRGNKLSKKRNHVNRFMIDYPRAEFLKITPKLLPKVKDCFDKICAISVDSEMAKYERSQTWNVLDNLEKYPFETLCIIVDGEVVAFTIGEVISDILHVHIEKAIHNYNGASEMINKAFVVDILKRHNIKYVNREDDAGDEGLRKAKMSYHQTKLLAKYNVIF